MHIAFHNCKKFVFLEKIKGEKPLLVPTFLGDFHFSP